VSDQLGGRTGRHASAHAGAASNAPPVSKAPPARRRRARILAAAVAGLALAAGGIAWRIGRDGTPPPEQPRAAPLRIVLPLNPAELAPAQLARALDQARQAGASAVSAGVAWWYVTRGRAAGGYDWRGLDRLVEAATARRMAVRLQLSGTPDAVHPRLAATVHDPDSRVWYPPRTAAELRLWGQFVRDTVSHFAGRVSSFEIWNEPNIEAFWRPTPSPAEYARLLAEAYRSAKEAWPSARVVFGGLSHNDVGFLQRYYSEARRIHPDAAAHEYFFDLLSVHPYTDGRSPDETSPDTVVQGVFGPVDKSFEGLRVMKAVLDRNEGERSAAGKSVVVGEFGFTTGSRSTPAVPDRRRAYYLKRALALAEQMPFVSELSWYGYLPDSGTPPGWAIAGPDQYTGWTYRALLDLAAPRSASRPAITLPDPSVLRPGPAEIRPVLHGLAPSDVVHTELYADGALVGQSDGLSVHWTSREPFVAGRVQVVVYTRDRHAWPSELVTVTGTD
jgi:polysaccharide biosynthesis protein PslG